MKDFMFQSAVVILVLTNGIIIGMRYNKLSDTEHALIKQQEEEYAECIAELPRNKDCTLTGFVFTVTTKQD